MCRESLKKKIMISVAWKVSQFILKQHAWLKKAQCTHPLKKTQPKPTRLTFLNRQVNEIVQLLFHDAQRIVMRTLL